jgi:hypothetical protein
MSPLGYLSLPWSHLSRFNKVSLLLRLKVIAIDVSFLVACLAKSFSGGRHAPFLSNQLAEEAYKNNNLLEMI